MGVMPPAFHVFILACTAFKPATLDPVSGYRCRIVWLQLNGRPIFKSPNLKKMQSITNFQSQIQASIQALKKKILNLDSIHRIENSKLKDLVQITKTKRPSLFVIDESKIQYVKKEILKMGIDSELKNRELILKTLKVNDGSGGKLAESFKVDIRNKRMEARNALKKMNSLKEFDGEIQKLTDEAIKSIEKLTKNI